MALTRITKGVIKPNENYDTHNINSTGIVTAIGLDVNGNGDISGNLSVGGVLTYEDVTSIDSVGIITARDGIHVGAGVSAVGVGTFSGLDISGDIDVDGHTNLDNVSIAGIVTATDLTVEKSGNLNVNIKSTGGWGALEVGGATAGYIDIKKPFSDDFDLRLMVDGSGTNYISSNAANLKLDAQGNNGIELGAYGAPSLKYSNDTKLVTTSAGVSIPKDLDVDGHTNLDNVSVSGITTFSGIVDAVNTPASIRVAQDIQHKGDANTKISFPANDEISFDTNGHDRIYIKSNGFIGMGTVTPAVDIHNFTDGVVGNSLRLENREGYVNFGNDANGLYIDAEYVNFRNRAGSTTYASINTSGNLSVFKDLDVDGHTELDNVRIVGVTTTNTLVIGDTSDTQTSTSDNRIRIGNNQDLQIFHGPNNSYIRNTTNSFNIEQYANATLDIFSNHDVRLRVNGGELAVDCSHNQGVDLYYDASVHTSPKISTRSNGAYVNGLLEILLNASQSTSTPLLLQNSAAAGTSSNPDVVKLAFGSQGSVKASIRAAVYGEGHMTFHTNNDTEKVRITAAGRVGIMETSPDRSLHIKDSGIIKLENTSTGGWAGLEYLVSSGTNNYDAYMGLQDSDGLFFIDNNSNGIDFCIKQNGNIGMAGETNPIAPLTLNKGDTGANTTYANAELIRIEGYGTTNSKSGIGFGRYNGGQNGYVPAAFIGAQTGTWSGHTNCHLVFATRNTTGNDNPTERLRITNDGKVVAGGDGSGYPERLQAHGAGSCLGLNSTSGAAELRFYESGTGRFRMKTLAGNPGIIFEDWTNSATRAEIDGSGDFIVYKGTRGWSTIGQRSANGGGHILRRHVRTFNASSSGVVYNLIRVRRHYWGWGHYKFTIKRYYYSGIAEDVYYLNGHGRSDGSYNISYSIGRREYGGDGSNFGYSGRIQIATPSTSSPGDSYAAYVDVQLNCPAYMWFQVEVEAASAGYSTDPSTLGSDTYALHS